MWKLALWMFFCPAGAVPKQCLSLSMAASCLHALQKKDSGISYQLFLFLRFIPSISLENLQRFLEIQSASPWMRANPTAESTSTWFFFFLNACDVVVGIILRKQNQLSATQINLRVAEINSCFTEWSCMLLSITTYSAVLTVSRSGPCAHIFYHQLNLIIIKK